MKFFLDFLWCFSAVYAFSHSSLVPLTWVVEALGAADVFGAAEVAGVAFGAGVEAAGVAALGADAVLGASAADAAEAITRPATSRAGANSFMDGSFLMASAERLTAASSI